MTTRIPRFSFSFYRHGPVRCDFSGGQITSDTGLLPLRSFDERHHLTSGLAELFSDQRQSDRVLHDSLALLRQRLYQIVAGYEDANDADPCVMTPPCRSLLTGNWPTRSVPSPP